MKTLFKIILILVLLLVIAGGVLGYKTFGTTGEDAVAKMSESEKVILDKVVTISKGMTYEEVVVILGEPTDLSESVAPIWTVNGEQYNRLVVLFGHSGVTSAKWTKFWSFYYEHDGVVVETEEES